MGRAWVCLEGRADRGEEAGVALMKGKAVGDCQTPSLGLEWRLGPFSLACSGTCWPRHSGGLVMHRAGILGCHSSRKFFTPQPTPFLSDLKSAPPAGPSPLSRVAHLLMSCLGIRVAMWAAMPLITTRQGTALRSVTLNCFSFLNPCAPNHRRAHRHSPPCC